MDRLSNIEDYKDKYVEFDVPPRRSGCRKTWHDGYKGSGTVIYVDDYWDEVDVKCEDGSIKTFDIKYITCVASQLADRA